MPFRLTQAVLLFLVPPPFYGNVLSPYTRGAPVLATQMVSAPKGKLPAKQEAEEEFDEELMARLAGLRAD